VDYVNVKGDPQGLQRMMQYDQSRRVPLIVEGERVTVGYGGT
jgi:hypothetical protein